MVESSSIGSVGAHAVGGHLSIEGCSHYNRVSLALDCAIRSRSTCFVFAARGLDVSRLKLVEHPSLESRVGSSSKSFPVATKLSSIEAEQVHVHEFDHIRSLMQSLAMLDSSASNSHQDQRNAIILIGVDSLTPSHVDSTSAADIYQASMLTQRPAVQQRWTEQELVILHRACGCICAGTTLNRSQATDCTTSKAISVSGETRARLELQRAASNEATSDIDPAASVRARIHAQFEPLQAEAERMRQSGITGCGIGSGNDAQDSAASVKLSDLGRRQGVGHRGLSLLQALWGRPQRGSTTASRSGNPSGHIAHAIVAVPGTDAERKSTSSLLSQGSLRVDTTLQERNVRIDMRDTSLAAEHERRRDQAPSRGTIYMEGSADGQALSRLKSQPHLGSFEAPAASKNYTSPVLRKYQILVSNSVAAGAIRQTRPYDGHCDDCTMHVPVKLCDEIRFGTDPDPS